MIFGWRDWHEQAGRYVREQCDKHGLRPSEAARRLGYTHSHWCDLQVRGDRSTYPRLHAIFLGFGLILAPPTVITPDYLPELKPVGEPCRIPPRPFNQPAATEHWQRRFITLLYKRRRHLGLSQRAICARTGMTRESQKLVENYQMWPHAETIDKLLRALGLDMAPVSLTPLGSRPDAAAIRRIAQFESRRMAALRREACLAAMSAAKDKRSTTETVNPWL